MFGGRFGLVGAVAAGLVLAGCPVEERDEAEPPVDVWDEAVAYRDPDGAFEIEFPVEPAEDQDVQGPTDRPLVLHSLTADAGRGGEFSLGWSDAPAGTPLVRTQAIAPGTAEENAERDGGEVIDERDVTLFGRAALEFSVDGAGDSGYYYNVRVVLGGRLYELTVIRRDDSREAFDRFVESFVLLQPPLADDADFFARAERLCSDFFSDRPAPAEDASPAERGAEVGEVVDFYEGLVSELIGTPASALDQGEAAAFIDVTRRSIAPARVFAEAVAADAPDVRELGQATHSDTDLQQQLAADNGAPSCA